MISNILTFLLRSRSRFRSLYMASFALALVILISSPVQAEDRTIEDGTDLTDTVNLNDGDTLIVEENASITGDYDGVVSSGTVDINNKGAITGNEIGILIWGSDTSLDNSGTITGGNDGISVFEGGISNLINSGIITGVNDDGIYVSGDIINLNNSGAITGDDDGVFAGGDIVDLINSGIIEGINGNGLYSTGTIENLINSDTGIIEGGINGIFASSIINLDNSGSITGHSDEPFEGNGIFAIDINNLNNSGTIQGTNMGIFALTITGLTNSGSITGGDKGIYVLEDITSLTNSGIIEGDIQGIYAFGDITDLTNSGIIEGGTTGIYTYGVTSITNSGIIQGGGVGISSLDISTPDFPIQGTLASLINSGTIQGGNTGINVNYLTSLTNSGTIIGGAYAIKVWNDGDTELTILAGSNIQGMIDLGGGINTLNVGNGLSISYSLRGIDTVLGDIASPLYAIRTEDDDTGGNTYVAVVDTTNLLMQDDVVIDLTSGISRSVSSALKSARKKDDKDRPKTGVSLWANVFGSDREKDGTSSTTDADHQTGGLVSGFDTPIGSSSHAGAFIGGAVSEVETAGDQNSDIDSFFGGVYVGTHLGPMTVDLMLTGGWTDHEWSRTVGDNFAGGGFDTAQADFDGTFISPEIAVSFDSGFLGLVPSARIRYIGYFQDEFSETGASDELTIKERDLHLLHARFQIAAPIIVFAGTTLIEPYVGVEGVSELSDGTVDAVLLGQSVSFDPDDDDDDFTGYVGLTLASQVSSNIGFYGNVETNFETFEDDGSQFITGNAGVKVTF